MSERPEWVHCVATGETVQKGQHTKSWCGEIVSNELHFTDASHAALNGRNGGYQVACTKCVDEIVKALRNGVEEA